MKRWQVPSIRLRAVNDRPVRPDGAYVLYWMIAARRSSWNFALQRAVAQAVALDRPLLILETLRCDYPYASDRMHRFIIDGMSDNRQAFADRPVHYFPFVAGRAGEDRQLLLALAEQACMVVSDDFPAFIVPDMLADAGESLPVALEAVDGNGLLPLRLADHAYPTAYAFRRFLQKTLPAHLLTTPMTDPLAGTQLPTLERLPTSIVRRWPAADLDALRQDGGLADLPIDHKVAPAQLPGGSMAAADRLEDFIAHKLSRYAELRSHPDEEVTSGLSPYLHFGQIASHAIFAALSEHEGWSPDRLGPERRGQRSGWWGMSIGAEAFLDQLVTWRELGYNMCTHEPHYRDYASLPEWARRTLEARRLDPRPVCYTPEELDRAQTGDPIWNAAQRQLKSSGVMHNYLRMLWGKKILEWSPSPQEALQTMLDLNDRYALDGRDPNSYSGIFWCLGRYDRPWGPTRPIFGSIRYMSSENTRRKLRLNRYLREWGDA